MKRLLALFLLVPALLLAQVEGRVVSVTDGDTIKVLAPGQQLVKVRLWGIDAPESKQAFGNRSKEALASLVAGRQVRLETKGKDRYGRTLAVVWVDGRSANLAQVEGGWAWWYQSYAPRAVDLKNAEVQARRGRLGLWQDPAPTAPWAWRKNTKDR